MVSNMLQIIGSAALLSERGSRTSNLMPPLSSGKGHTLDSDYILVDNRLVNAVSETKLLMDREIIL